MQTIGILSAYNGVGNTHTCISIASALKRKKYKVAVVDLSDTNSIYNLGEELDQVDEETECFSYQGIDFVLNNNFSLAKVRREGYDYCIFDFGTNLVELFYQMDFSCLMASGRIWNLSRPELEKVCDTLDDNIGLDVITFVFPFSDSASQKEIRKFCEGSKVIFPDLEESPFTSEFDVSVFGCEENVNKVSIFDSIRSKTDNARITKMKKENEELKNSISHFTNKLSEKDKELERQLSEKEKQLSEKEKELEKQREEMTSEIAKAQQSLAQKETELSSLGDVVSQSEQSLKEKEQALKELEQKAFLDSLTGLRNYTGFVQYKTGLDTDGKYLVFIDVNYLKATNDTLGHFAGDKLLKTISDNLQDNFKDVFRVGGDEFVAISENNPKTLLEEIDNKLKSLSTNDEGITYQIAYGFVFINDYANIDIAYQKADALMYQNKEEKKLTNKQFADYVDDRIPVPETVAQNETPMDEASSELVSADTGSEELVSLGIPVSELAVDEPKECQSEPTPVYDVSECIFGTVPETEEVAETEEYKFLSTMWYARYTLKYESKGKYNECNIYVFPTEYAKPPCTTHSVIAVETFDGYEVYQGKNIEFEFNHNKFTINSRFFKDGRFSVVCNAINDDVEVFTDNCQVTHRGEYTPKHFGKQLNLIAEDGREINIEIFPIRQNVNGFCDCIMKIDDELQVSSGTEVLTKKSFSFILDDDKFLVMREE